jgi:putative endopeptidase
VRGSNLTALLIAALLASGASLLCAQDMPPGPEIGTFGFDEAGMDLSVKPGDDFFAYANGTWVRNTPIPDDKPSWGSYVQQEDVTNQRLREILETAAADPANRIGRAYASYLDTSRVEELGLEPIRPWLDRIKALEKREDYTELVAEALAMRVGAPLVFWVWQDDKQPELARLMIDQAGLGMGSRELYLDDTAGYAEIRAAYQAHLVKLLVLSGEAKDEAAAQARAAAVMKLETEIARVHWVRADAEDMVKTYHKFSVADTAEFSTPGLNLKAILEQHGPNLTEVQIREPSAVKGIAAIVDRAPLPVLKDQLVLRSLDGLSEALPAAIQEQSFSFYGTLLAGTPQQEPRWLLAVKFVSDALRDELGKEYAARYFPPEYKAEMQVLVDNLVVAMGERIDELEWMQPATKARAKEKLGRLTVRTGYPDQWREYAGLEIKSDDRFGNRVRASQYDFHYMMQRASEPSRWWEWSWFGAQTVNANANYNLLQLTFPAAFLQAPAFDPNADPAINYGAIGAVAAHEISHNFDDTGAKYNEHGIQEAWWPPEDVKAFEAAGDSLVAQYDAYEVLPDLFVNGRISLGENISDLAGLTIAFDAWKKSLGGKPAPVINGFTGEQRFFLGWAQFWRTKSRDEYLRQVMLAWRHSPDIQRVWTVRNIDAWYEAFDVQPGDKLYLPPEERVRVW